jgi:hypothetical protein
VSSDRSAQPLVGICHLEQGAEATIGQPLGVLARLVLDVEGGDRRAFALECVAARNAVDEPPLP